MITTSTNTNINSSTDKSPPTCLNEKENLKRIQPICAFEKCIYPHACHGSKNPGFYILASEKNGGLYDPAGPTSNLTEECNEEKGYSNYCRNDDNNDVTRCRLCATCKEGYKRAGIGTLCKLCLDPTMNKIFLGIGLIVMIIGSIVLVYMQINSERNGDDISKPIKKIIGKVIEVSRS